RNVPTGLSNNGVAPSLQALGFPGAGREGAAPAPGSLGADVVPAATLGGGIPGRLLDPPPMGPGDSGTARARNRRSPEPAPGTLSTYPTVWSRSPKED